jgi:hypothetical protein
MRLVTITLVVICAFIDSVIGAGRTPTKNDLMLISSMSAQAAHEACILSNNPACFSILDTALAAYNNDLIEHFGARNYALCEDVSLEAFRLEFNRFFPYQPGLHSLPASDFLGLVLMLKWSCKRIKMRNESIQ